MFTVELTDTDSLLKALDKRDIERAHVRAANKSVQQGQTAWNKAIREDYAVSAKDVRKTTRLSKLASMAQSAGITLVSGPTPLKRFKPKQTARGVTVRIKKNQGRKLIKSAFGPDARLNLNEHVFRRRGTARLKIDKMFTLSVPQMGDDQSVINQTLGKMEGAYATEFARQLKLFGERL